MKNDTQISLRIPAGDLADLRRLAADDDRSVNWLVRQAVGQYLARRIADLEA